jgi:DNA-binding GntR family transcriptional regulator
MTLSIEALHDISEVALAGTRTARLYEILKERIVSRELPPGTRLKHAELASAFGVSSTPVREAIHQLEKDGLVETFPYRGSIVKQLSAKEIRDIFEVRVALESLAVRLAASQLTDEQLRELERHAKDYERSFKTGDRALGMESDLAFHELLLRASGNLVLLDLANNLANRIQLFRQVDWDEARKRPSLNGHRLILEALREDDGDKAERLMSEHISRGKAKVTQVLAPGESEFESGRDSRANSSSV